LPTDLRYDLEFLRKLLTIAMGIHGVGDPPEYKWWTDIQDYLVYLTVDAYSDKELANKVVQVFDQLQHQLIRGEIKNIEGEFCRDVSKHYDAFLCALEQVLCLRYEIEPIPIRPRSRREFVVSWSETMKNLRL